MTLFAQVPSVVVAVAVATTVGWGQGLRAADEGGCDNLAGF